MTCILSIIIPTRNRAKYAISTIDSILSITSCNIELVVQDNSDNNELTDLLTDHLLDSRLKYNHTMEQIDVIRNFNQAMELASGEYVTFIGDDDGVNPEIVDAAIWAKSNDIDALNPALKASYYWPDFKSRYFTDECSGKLYIEKFTGCITHSNVEYEMKRCISNPGLGTLGLPKVYMGIVRRRCMIDVHDKTGAYFGGVSPDVFSALAVSNYVKKACNVDYPLIIPGSSSAATSGRSALGKHKGSLEDDPHMKPFKNLQWPDIIPRFFSVETVWAEAAVEALQATGRSDLLKEYNYPLLHAMCAVSHPDYLTTILSNLLKSIRATNRGYLKGIFQFIFGITVVMWRLCKKILYRIRYTKPHVRALRFVEAKSIKDAVDGLTNHLRSNNISFTGVARDAFSNKSLKM